MKTVKHLRQMLVVVSAAITLSVTRTHGDVVVLNPSKDNTLIQPSTVAPNNSNGLGSVYCGRTASTAEFARRRAVLKFDIAGSIPANSVITGATLTMRLETSVSGNQSHVLRKLLGDWGEADSFGLGAGGPASIGDTTWDMRFWDTQPWTTPGGDYSSTVTATTTIGGTVNTDFAWTSAQMVADVQNWLDTPAGNFGWIMIGNETGTGTAKGFYSREAANPAHRPRLSITYTPPKVDCPEDVDNNGSVDVDDLIAVILAWGCTSPAPGGCPADVNGNGVVDVDDLIAVILAWGPCT